MRAHMGFTYITCTSGIHYCNIRILILLVLNEYFQTNYTHPFPPLQVKPYHSGTGLPKQYTLESIQYLLRLRVLNHTKTN